MKNLFKKEIGITLIALIITIIIVLILANITISILTLNNGLFEKTKKATNIYEHAAQDEAEMIKNLINNEYFLPKTDGSFNYELGVNSPDTSKLSNNNIKYITWNNNNNGTFTEIISNKQTDNWYNYSNGQWANIKTTNINENLEAYWVWIPRFAYKLPESDTAKEIEVIFVKNNSKTGVLPDGTEINCYYSTDPEITANESGLYVDATEFAKGTKANQEQAYIIHPAFTFDNIQLNGFWVAKFEASNNLGKVEIKPNATPWCEISMLDIFRVSREIQETNGVLGNNSENNKINSHMIKNIEWGAIAILSQSKYGIFNPLSSTGINGDHTYQIWNNPQLITGSAASTGIENGQDAANLNSDSCDKYNTGNGPKASTTGTVYGIYDMANGSFEYVAAAIKGNESNSFGTTDEKYIDSYVTTDDSSEAILASKIGDFILEIFPSGAVSGSRGWNNDLISFIYTTEQWLHRGGGVPNGNEAGIFKSNFSKNDNAKGHSFRPVFVNLTLNN